MDEALRRLTRLPDDDPNKEGLIRSHKIRMGEDTGFEVGDQILISPAYRVNKYKMVKLEAIHRNEAARARGEPAYYTDEDYEDKEERNQYHDTLQSLPMRSRKRYGNLLAADHLFPAVFTLHGLVETSGDRYGKKFQAKCCLLGCKFCTDTVLKLSVYVYTFKLFRTAYECRMDPKPYWSHEW